MAAATYDISNNEQGQRACEQGSVFSLAVFYKVSGVVQAITGWTARLQVRPSAASSAVLLDCTVANGNIVIDGPAGKAPIHLTALETAVLVPGKYRYDFYFIPDDDPELAWRAIQGEFEVTSRITRVEEAA
jgi:hypothetical protein